MKHRATSLLFAVATGVPAAVIAPPTAHAALTSKAVVRPIVRPVVTPRVLPTGAPACGNVMWKMPAPQPGCAEAYEVGSEIVRSVVDQGREIGGVLAVFGELEIPG